MKQFLNSFKNGDNDALIESIIAGYDLIFESDYGDSDIHIVEYKDRSNGLFVLDGIIEGKTVSKLYYSKSPIIPFTQNKNPDDYVYIEWIDTQDKYRGKGYATKLVKYLVDKFPDNTVIARGNSISTSLLQQQGVTLIESTNPWYPPREKLNVESDRDKVMYSMLSAFKALSPKNKELFMKTYVPRGTEIAIYSLEQLPTDVLIRMKENLMDIRDEEKDYKASLDREAKEARSKKSYERNMDKAYEEQRIDNEYQKAESRKEQQQLLNQKIDSGELDVDELKRLREDGVIDSHNQYIYRDELDKSLLGKAEKRLR